MTALAWARDSFARIAEPVLRERWRDVEQVAGRLLDGLADAAPFRFDAVPSGTVLAADDLTPENVFQLRIFDLGGDKDVDSAADRQEKSPALGLRAIRLSLRDPDLFDSSFASCSGPRCMVRSVSSFPC